MDWWKVLAETVSVSSGTILKMAYIAIPLLIGIECLKDIGLLEKLSARLQGITKFLRLPGEAALGLIVAFFIGVVFGSGVIMQITEDVKMTRTQLNTMFIFISMCHAVIEETVLFTAVGGNGIIVLLSRMMSALIFAFAYIWIIYWRGSYRTGIDTIANE